jgi:predicted dehydrogenase
MPSNTTRRRFLKASAAAGCLTFFPGVVTAQEKRPGPNERLAVGQIGVAGQGDYDLRQLATAGAEIVALCDVDEKRAGAARERFPRARFVKDFRKLFDDKGLDAVLVATPDHCHAPATLMALKAGLHVYCEKPLTHTVHEARLVAETAARMNRVTQMGTQMHATDNYRRVVELIRAQVIGTVREVHVWVGKTWNGGAAPTGTPPVPEGLDWDLWLGPAATRPYHPAYLPANWRRFWDFGGGTMADMACHYLDLPFWALDLRDPARVTAEGPEPHPEGAARDLMVTYEFPARGTAPALTLTWYDGSKRPPHFEMGTLPKWGDGVLFVGDKGMLLADYTKRKLLPEKDFEGFKAPPATIPASKGHHKEWLEACQTGGKTSCHFGYSGPLTETVLLGLAAYRGARGKAVTWHAGNLMVSDLGVSALLRKEYRKGWEF